MFITKRRLNEMLDKERQAFWKREDEKELRNELGRIYDRLIALEKKTGIIEEPKCCCCKNQEFAPVPNPIGY